MILREALKIAEEDEDHQQVGQGHLISAALARLDNHVPKEMNHLRQAIFSYRKKYAAKGKEPYTKDAHDVYAAHGVEFYPNWGRAHGYFMSYKKGDAEGEAKFKKHKEGLKEINRKEPVEPVKDLYTGEPQYRRTYYSFNDMYDHRNPKGKVNVYLSVARNRIKDPSKIRLK